MNGDYRSTDRKALAQFILASLGAALLLGSTLGAAAAWCRSCWCCWDVENEEPL